jgi:hypothetical protein
MLRLTGTELLLLAQKRQELLLHLTGSCCSPEGSCDTSQEAAAAHTRDTWTQISDAAHIEDTEDTSQVAAAEL